MARTSPATARAERLWRIPELLRLRPRTTPELAGALGVPVRTIQRDIRTLREHGLKIESPKRGVHEIAVQPATLNPVEALAVHAATRLLYHHAPVRNRHYQAALEKLAAMLPTPARELALRSTKEATQRRLDDRSLELVARAWFERRVLACEYRSTSGSGSWHRNELEILLVEINRENLAAYVIARERTFHHSVRTFKLARMRQAHLLPDRYEIPEDFDPLRYLSKAWGVVGATDRPPVKVRLRFAPPAAHRIREGGYPNLVIVADFDDGSLVAELEAGTDRAGFPKEILPWVRSWGPSVDVLAPPALRQRWLQDAATVAERDGLLASPIDAMAS